MNALGCLRGRYALLGSIFAFVLLWGGISGSVKAEGIDTTVCSLVAKPNAFDDKKVRVRARIVSSVEGAAIFDDSCTSQSVALWIEKDAREHADFKALNKASLVRGSKEPVKRIIVATLTGRFVSRS